MPTQISARNTRLNQIWILHLLCSPCQENIEQCPWRVQTARFTERANWVLRSILCCVRPRVMCWSATICCGSHMPPPLPRRKYNISYKQRIHSVETGIDLLSKQRPTPREFELMVRSAQLVSLLVGALSPVNHKGSHQGWTQTLLHLQVSHFTSHHTTKSCFF